VCARERIRFAPVPSDFAAVLEQRCQLLLDAQSAYSDAMRAYDAHWSAMAGFRVGELYQKLHEELMQVPAPKSADSAGKRQLFEGAMRLRYSILLDKAKAMMDHTVAMGIEPASSPLVAQSPPGAGHHRAGHPVGARRAGSAAIHPGTTASRAR